VISVGWNGYGVDPCRSSVREQGFLAGGPSVHAEARPASKSVVTAKPGTSCGRNCERRSSFRHTSVGDQRCMKTTFCGLARIISRQQRLRPAMPEEMRMSNPPRGQVLAIVARDGRVDTFAVGRAFSPKDDDATLASFLSALLNARFSRT
jgi:hypothetical protein